jgi:predicted transcriptional regulator
MPQMKIQGKFYPLQHEEFIKLNKRLTQSELTVYLWLKTNDNFEDKLIAANTKQIANDLNISRRAVQRALVKLQNFDVNVTAEEVES